METLLEYLVAAERVVIFTGAGISTAAGIPDFRGVTGAAAMRPEISIHDFLESAAARQRYWALKCEDFFAWQALKPTAAHEAMVTLQRLGKLAGVLTQNIDGLHRRSGIAPELLVELHGSLDEVVCVSCGFSEPAAPWMAAFQETGEVPLCPACGERFLKPGVIQFGESLREEALLRAQQAMMDVDLVIALGSTLMVQPASTFPIMAARAGVPYIVINQGETAHDGLPHVALRLEGDVQELFPAAVADAAAMFG